MIEPKEFTARNGKTFILTKFPAIAGREIITKYPTANMPKLGDYGVSEETMLKLMAFVGVITHEGGAPVMLTTRALVDNHAGDWETLAYLEAAMLEYNCSFFTDGRASTFFATIAQKAPAWISQTLTDSLGRLSPADKRPGTN